MGSRNSSTVGVVATRVALLTATSGSLSFSRFTYTSPGGASSSAVSSSLAMTTSEAAAVVAHILRYHLHAY